ncbi:unnamed protein product, partial [Musa hybrid cultivar]
GIKRSESQKLHRFESLRLNRRYIKCKARTIQSSSYSKQMWR